MNVLTESQWTTLQPALRKACPRLTPLDLDECQRRLDILTAKIQNRHWVDRTAAERLVFAVLQQAGIAKVA